MLSHESRPLASWLIFDVRQKMSASAQMTAKFVLERLEVIGGSAHERESGNEIEARMLAYLTSHRKGNEDAIREALVKWIRADEEPKISMAKYLLKKLDL